jgi:Outer membrane protein beta-barrel domain/PDZ domain
MRRICASLLFCFIASGLGLAQDSRADVFGGYSYLNLDTNGLSSRQNANGWEASVSGNFNKWFAAEADVSAYYKTYDIFGVNVPLRDYAYVAGPRINLKPVFVHALIGGDHLGGSTLGLSASQDGLAGAFGGGVQWKYSRHLSVRASADYVVSRHDILAGSPVTQSASVGIVYSFGVRGERTQQAAPIRESGMPIPVLGLRARTADNRGAEIIEVAPNSIADLAGLKVGEVINSLDGKPIRTAMELAAELANRALGTQIKLGYMIHGAWQTETAIILGNKR